ncbi:MAG: hypothetical protein WA061_01835 [Microgenomates group bacterium]
MLSKPLWQNEDGLKIFGNNHDVPIIYGYELSDKWKKEFDYYDAEELENNAFFKYKNWVFDLGEFMRVDGKNCPFEECPIKFDGHKSDSFFSGVLIKWSDEYGEFLKVYTYYS